MSAHCFKQNGDDYAQDSFGDHAYSDVRFCICTGVQGPAPQGDNVQKPGMTNSGQNNGSMKNTTGSSMSKDGMNKPVGGESKDGQGMNKGGAMSK